MVSVLLGYFRMGVDCALGCSPRLASRPLGARCLHVPGPISATRRKELQKAYWCAAVAWPRVLGTAVFVFVLIAMIKAYRNLSPAGGLPEAERALNQLTVLISVTFALGAIFFVLVWKRRRIDGWLNTRLKGKRRQWPAPDDPLLTGHETLILEFLRLLAKGKVAVSGGMAWVTIIVALFAGIVTIVFLVSLIAPHGIAEALPRAVFVPVVLGSSVLLLTEIGAYSMRFRAPLLLVLVLAGGLASFVIDRFHDVRWVGRTGKEDRQITIETAVNRWKQANDCDTNSERCPRPIIIAGSGGASRAAFMTASVVGAMLDLGNTDSAFRDVGKRIFALSTVSGSSVAAVTISAALQDAADAGHPSRPPCKKDVRDTAWFRAIDGRPDELWRDCLQKILAGDLLSPVLIGLFYRDSFPLGNPINGEPWWADRAALLEQALERRYKLVVDGNADNCRADDPNPLDYAGHWGITAILL